MNATGIVKPSVATSVPTACLLPLVLLLSLLVVQPLCAQTATDTLFRSEPIPDAVFARMQGKSFPRHCTVPRSELRYLRVSHYDREGRVHTGEMVCNKAIAADLLDIFRELYAHRYPIERMQLVDDYDADDERSMRANNTSCFCYRLLTGDTILSNHAYGCAIDLNPQQNPYVTHLEDGSLFWEHENASDYIDRTRQDVEHMITEEDDCYRIFTEHGFIWGGNWNSIKDYQHFQKPIN